MPVKGYASHGESWSVALALRLGSFELLSDDGDTPILILDDVFAELDSSRRSGLAALASKAEQIIVTCAVATDLPPSLDHHALHDLGGVLRVHGAVAVLGLVTHALLSVPCELSRSTVHAGGGISGG